MIYILQSDPQVPAGIYGNHLRERNLPHRMVRLFAGEELPEPGIAGRLIVLGGRMGVQDEEAFPFLPPLKTFLRQAAEKGTPLLGICLGGQLLAEVMGGKVTAGCRGEKGVTEIELTPAAHGDPLFTGLPPRFTTFMWHDDSFDLPPGSLHLAASLTCPGQAFRTGNAWGLQFHPEVDAATVAGWSAGEERQIHLDLFRRHETACRSTGLRILQNFLRFSSLRPQQG